MERNVTAVTHFGYHLVVMDRGDILNAQRSCNVT
jgi:hypothetical protein